MLEQARKDIKYYLDWDGEVIFTSGASEALIMAIKLAKVNSYLYLPTEHAVILREMENPPHLRSACPLDVDNNGKLQLGSLIGALEPMRKPNMIITQMVNNETGVVQDLDDICDIAHGADRVILADCAQSAGKIPLPQMADMITISAHKCGGPPGIGALLIRDLSLLEAAGGQEKGYRSGTENLPGAMAFAAALGQSRRWMENAKELRHQLDKAILSMGGAIVAERALRLPTISAYHMPGVSANNQLIECDLAGISVSAGSACSSGTLKSSHVLTAMGWDDQSASEVIRVSIGPETRRADIYRFTEIWQQIYSRHQEKIAAQNAGDGA